MLTYSKHYCTRGHKSYSTFARCIWGKRAHWVIGEGPYALLAWCGGLTVSLHDTEDSALSDKAMIDKTGCGGHCNNDHRVLRLELHNGTSN